mgnify:FL=1
MGIPPKPAGDAGDAVIDPPSLRALCRSMLVQIPDAGLPELYGFLRELREFHALRTTPPPPALVTRPIKALSGQRTVRPEFHLELEEE